MSGVSAAPADTKRFDGDYLVWRKAGQHLRKGLTQPGAEALKRDRSRPPRFRHPDQASAEREAARLAQLCPGTTFVVIHEVGRVKMPEPLVALAPPSARSDDAPRRILSPRYQNKEVSNGSSR